MKKKTKERNWRRLDNTAKIFSVEEKKNTNTFRLTAILTEPVTPEILKKAVLEALVNYPSYRVKLKAGLFWNYFKDNTKEPLVKKERYNPSRVIRFYKSNDYLFRVTYSHNRINLDIYHMLTDGLGASILLKEILYNYLNLKYELNIVDKKVPENHTFSKDEYLKNVNRNLMYREEKNKAFLIQEKSNYLRNKTYYYILNLKKVKEICKSLDVSISEYLAALYIYGLYESVYDKDSKKDIILNIPIDLRKHYKVQCFSNFFTCMSVISRINKRKKISFEYILKNIHQDFRSKLTPDKLDRYLSRDVATGTNIAVSVVPLFVKKIFMKYLGRLVSQSTTTTFSNLGIMNVEKPYKKYIENILTIVNAGRFQKIKCTICTYENNLNITINSNLFSDKFEKEFYKLLIEYVGEVKVENGDFEKVKV